MSRQEVNACSLEDSFYIPNLGASLSLPEQDKGEQESPYFCCSVLASVVFLSLAASFCLCLCG
jgi:hypothetical protein